jgi:Ala-tRNA(Pro) deacylase
MGIPKKITKYLDDLDINYSHILHPPGYTAEEVAHKIHCAKHELAKVIAVHFDDQDALLIIPASDRLDIASIHKIFNTKKVDLYTEKELNLKFTDCETGAMPVFGNLYGLKVIASDNLLEDSDIYFNAGTHCDAIRCKMEDFIKFVHPKFAHISNLHKDNYVCRDLCY